MGTVTPIHAGGGRKSFVTLNAVHAELDEQFLTHQEHLLAGRMHEARLELDAFIEGMTLHMRQEEDVLLPIYAERGEPQPPALRLPLAVFYLEHRKLQSLIGKIRAQLATLERPGPRRIIELLEREAVFKHVLEHHGERENLILYPELNRVTSEDERAGLVDQLLDEWVTAARPARWAAYLAASRDAVAAAASLTAPAAAAGTVPGRPCAASFQSAYARNSP